MEKVQQPDRIFKKSKYHYYLLDEAEDFLPTISSSLDRLQSAFVDSRKDRPDDTMHLLRLVASRDPKAALCLIDYRTLPVNDLSAVDCPVINVVADVERFTDR